MTARQEVEDILEQRVWADRNQLDPYGPLDNSELFSPVALPPMKLIEDYEARKYRDCPMEYDTPTANVFRELALFVAFGAGVLVVAALASWVWNNTWAYLVH